METKTITSKQFNLGTRDFWKGLLLAVLIPVFVVIQESLEQGSFDFNWPLLAKVAISSMAAYLGKNFFDKPKVIVVTNSNEDAQTLKENISK